MTAVLARYVPWTAYPGTLGMALLIHLLLLNQGQSLVVSTYTPVFIGDLMVTLLELGFPNESAWRPGRRELGQDLLYMVLVQMLLPKLLALAVVLAVIGVIGDNSLPLGAAWPHDSPVAVQALLLILAADFLRYWLHVAAHRVPWLWRLHAVHHSPQRLYWLNVGRFHPFEKVLQFLFDTLPFIMLGVGAEVVALYFVFYAVNGFFQHSNIKLRYGWLNYIISSAELHRWHHSRIPQESNSNYGNNIIIWDILFGTRFLPGGKTVGELGLKNRRYPGDFIDQLVTPFTPAITDYDVPLKPPRRGLRRLWLRGRMLWIRLFIWQPLLRASKDPAAAQAAVLKDILDKGRETRFGREHGFGGIACYSDFTRQVPLQDYESLRPYIEAQEQGEPAALTVEPPFMYAVTSGTTGLPKYIPVLNSTLRQYQAGQQIFSLMLYRFCPQAFAGKALGIASAAVEGHRPSGIPYGSVSGHLYASMPRLVRANYVVPPAVNAIADHELKYRVMLRLALSEPDITYFAGANPSSFIKLLAVLNTDREAFIDSLEHGGMRALGELDGALAELLAGRLGACPERAEQLRRIPPDTDISYAMLWPNLRLVTVWTKGSCGIALGALRQTLPGATRVIDLGFLSSELRVSVTIDPQSGAGLAMLNQHFYEFIAREDRELGHNNYRRLHELETGREYYLVVTTAAGLYRYCMNDIIQVTGRFQATPTFCFVQKGRGATSITGEKVYEHQVLEAVESVLSGSQVYPVFVMALADETDNRYRVFVEAESVPANTGDELAEMLDVRLGEYNIEYRSKRASGRLQPLCLDWLVAGSGDAYRRYCVANGQREAQFKPVALQLKSEFGFPIEEYRHTDD